MKTSVRPQTNADMPNNEPIEPWMALTFMFGEQAMPSKEKIMAGTVSHQS